MWSNWLSKSARISPFEEQISNTLVKIFEFVEISLLLINQLVEGGIHTIHSKKEIEKWLNEGFKGNTLIFILFLYDGIQWNLGDILRYSRVLGVRPFTSPKSPSFNEYHRWFSSFHTPRTREYRKFSPKFRWIPSYKNKINMSVFPLKPSFSHFSISFLLWIPSMSILQDNRTVAW